MRQPDNGDLLNAKQLCSLKAAVTGNDRAIVGGEDWVGESEPGDTVRDLPDLLFRMGSSVTRICSQLGYLAVLDRHFRTQH
jgi:hypothetical protein